MSFENPTLLRIGMNGNFSGKDYRVAGRVVMGETEGGETYYWNEFNLESQDGSYADLVFEETERGGEWRLFTLFKPEYPMTAVDAATKRVGDRLNLTGEDVRVTLRSTSRVCHIEGQAPEGVEIGDVANYFNAEAGNDMQVVSWTGNEVEYYNGVNIPQSVVAAAFHVPRASNSSSFSDSDSSWLGGNDEHYDSVAKFFLKAALVIFCFFIVFGRHFSCSTDYESSTLVKKVNAAAPPLTVGAPGKLLGWNYHISAHAIVEIAEVGARYERHEYQLLDDDGHPALLVCGWKPESDNWFLFTPVEPSMVLSSQQAGAKKLGDIVALDNLSAPVGELFQSTIRQLEPEPSLSPGVKKGNVYFGFTAQSPSALLLARWNAGGITFHRGKSLPAKDIIAAFNQPAGK
jgi:hypothetical protein